jgi:hypothetical protein
MRKEVIRGGNELLTQKCPSVHPSISVCLFDVPIHLSLSHFFPFIFTTFTPASLEKPSIGSLV